MYIIVCHQQQGVKWPQCHKVDCLKARCVSVLASIKFHPTYKIFQCYVTFWQIYYFCGTIRGEDNKFSFEMLMMKIDQILIYLFQAIYM